MPHTPHRAGTRGTTIYGVHEYGDTPSSAGGPTPYRESSAVNSDNFDDDSEEWYGERVSTPTPNGRLRGTQPRRTSTNQTPNPNPAKIFDDVRHSFATCNFLNPTACQEWAVQAVQVIQAISEGMGRIQKGNLDAMVATGGLQARQNVEGVLREMAGQWGVNLDLANCGMCQGYHGHSHPIYREDEVAALEEEIRALKEQIEKERAERYHEAGGPRSGLNDMKGIRESMAAMHAAFTTLTNDVKSNFSRIENKITTLQQVQKTQARSTTPPEPAPASSPSPPPPPHTSTQQGTLKPTFAEVAASSRNASKPGSQEWTEVQNGRKGKEKSAQSATSQRPQASTTAKPQYTKVIARWTAGIPTTEQIPSEMEIRRLLVETLDKIDSAKQAKLHTIIGVERSTKGHIILVFPPDVKTKDIIAHQEVIRLAISEDWPLVIQTDDNWTKLVVLGSPSHDGNGEEFSSEVLLNFLKQNPFFQKTEFTWSPRWMISPGVKVPARASFSVGVVDPDGAIARKLERKPVTIYMTGLRCLVRTYREREIRLQCFKCWQKGHLASACTDRVPTCVFCKGGHKFTEHGTKCPCAINSPGSKCVCKAACATCAGEHRSDDANCPTWKGFRAAKGAMKPDEPNPSYNNPTQPGQQRNPDQADAEMN
jgi:hypothetical protein